MTCSGELFALPTASPEGAVLIAAEALSARVGGKVFRIKFADGSGARVDYKSNGYALLVLRFTNELTNEIDGFVRQARRKPQP